MIWGLALAHALSQTPHISIQGTRNTTKVRYKESIRGKLSCLLGEERNIIFSEVLLEKRVVRLSKHCFSCWKTESSNRDIKSGAKGLQPWLL